MPMHSLTRPDGEQPPHEAFPAPSVTYYLDEAHWATFTRMLNRPAVDKPRLRAFMEARPEVR